MASEHIEIPIAEARRLAEQYRKTHVIIIGYDAAAQMFHTTTFGRDAAHKHQAAKAGEIATKALGADIEQKTSYEDFRETRISALETALGESVELAEELRDWRTCDDYGEPPNTDARLAKLKAVRDGKESTDAE